MGDREGASAGNGSHPRRVLAQSGEETRDRRAPEGPGRKQFQSQCTWEPRRKDPVVRAEVGWGAPKQGGLSMLTSFVLLPLISFQGYQLPSPAGGRAASKEGQPTLPASGGTGKGRDSSTWMDRAGGNNQLRGLMRGQNFHLVPGMKKRGTSLQGVFRAPQNSGPLSY